MPNNHTNPTGIRPALLIGVAAAVITSGLLVGTVWATVDIPGRIGVAMLLLTLAVVTSTASACVVMDHRAQRRQREVLETIHAAVEKALETLNQAEWRGFAAGVRENLGAAEQTGAPPVPRIGGTQGRRRPTADS